MGKTPKLSYAGRISLNSQNTNELWINCGWYGYDHEWDDNDLQVYPEYDEKLRECRISLETYESLISFTKEQISTTGKPCISSDSACLLCCCTCGLIFCPLCNLKSNFKECEQKLIGAFATYTRDNLHNAGWAVSLRLEREKYCQRATSKPWVDSTGQTLILDTLSGPGNPPPGMNLVLTFPQGVPCTWPEPSPDVPTNATTAATASPPTMSSYNSPSPYPPGVQYAPYTQQHQQHQSPPLPQSQPHISQYPTPPPQSYSPQVVYVTPGPVATTNDPPPPYEASPPTQQGPNFCPHCGAKCVGAAFCGQCGAKLF